MIRTNAANLPTVLGFVDKPQIVLGFVDDEPDNEQEHSIASTLGFQDEPNRFEPPKADPEKDRNEKRLARVEDKLCSLTKSHIEVNSCLCALRDGLTDVRDDITSVKNKIRGISRRSNAQAAVIFR